MRTLQSALIEQCFAHMDLHLQNQTADKIMAAKQFVDSDTAHGLNKYADLISYGMLDTMRSIYPLCVALLGRQRFDNLVCRYLTTYRPNSYRLNMIGSRFPFYLKDSGAWNREFPFLNELADYEWIELEVAESLCLAIKSGDQYSLDSQQAGLVNLALNPTVVLRNYCYPIPVIAKSVREITGESIEPELWMKSDTRMAIFREFERERVIFLELERVPFAILQSLEVGVMKFSETFLKIRDQFKEIDQESLLQGILEVVSYLEKRGALTISG